MALRSVGRISGVKLIDFNPSQLHLILRTDPRSLRFAQNIGRLKKASAQRLAPVDTGTLRDSINYAVYDAETGWEVVIYATAPYAMFVEFGTRNAERQPFLRPAPIAPAITVDL